jgi:hypothetical protein
MKIEAASLWLDESSPVPVDRPFSRSEAQRLGVPDRQLSAWVASGHLSHPLRGVYYASQIPDDIGLRIACIRLVAPENAVVTDRTAGWALGAPMILAPGAHLATPDVSMFLTPGNRLRSKWSSSGERTFGSNDLVAIDGVTFTTPLRTACDLGRLLHRDQAFAGLDSMLRLDAFTLDELCAEVERFKGYRRVRQLRALAPLADARSQSPGESILRLRWLDCVTLPPPTPQLEVPGPFGSYFLDLGVEGLRYAAEYDGAEWHGPDKREHDQKRRDWVEANEGYAIDVFIGVNIHGRKADAEGRLQQGIAKARRQFGRLR